MHDVSKTPFALGLHIVSYINFNIRHLTNFHEWINEWELIITLSVRKQFSFLLIRYMLKTVKYDDLMKI